MFTKFYRCPSCKMTLEAHIITSIRNARPLAERSLRHVHSGSSVHLSSKQYSAVWVVPSLQSLQIHRPVTRRERESQYRAPKPYKESRCRLVKPSPSDQQGLQCIPTSGWHSTRRQASRRHSFMPYRNPICRLSGIPSVGIFSSIHCSCLLMDTRFSETFHIRLLEHVFPGWIPSAKQSTSIENNHSFFITGFQIIFRPPLQRSQAIFFFNLLPARPFLGRPYLGTVGCAPFGHPCRQHEIKTDEFLHLRSFSDQPFCQITPLFSFWNSIYFTWLCRDRRGMRLSHFVDCGYQRDMHSNRVDFISNREESTSQRHCHIVRLRPLKLTRLTA